jgi:hypothetical protein
VLLVTGPFKVNGVPLRRVNARYVIATSTSVDLKGVDEGVLKKASEDGYFTKDKASKKPGEESFFKQGEKVEVRIQVRLKRWTGTDYCYRRRRPPRIAWGTRSLSTRHSWPPSRRRATSLTT